MLSRLVKDHQTKQQIRKDIQETKRKEAVLAASNFTHALVDHLNVRVAQAYLNQKKLDSEAKQLHLNASQFAKQTFQWLHLIENFNQSLKELGDVENWSQSIESDIRTISSALECAYKEPRLVGTCNSRCEEIESVLATKRVKGRHLTGE